MLMTPLKNHYKNISLHNNYIKNLAVNIYFYINYMLAIVFVVCKCQFHPYVLSSSFEQGV
jgi:hypothetical protein